MNRAMATWGVVITIVAVLVAILSVVLPPVQPDQLSVLPIVVVVLLVIAAALFLQTISKEISGAGGGTKAGCRPTLAFLGSWQPSYRSERGSPGT